VVILGDSWVRGLLFERRHPFGKLIAEGINASEVLDLSAQSRTTVDVVSCHLGSIGSFRPDVAIVNIGGADSLIFPRAALQRLVERWVPMKHHGARGWMPPASYSSKPYKRAKQRATHIVRIVMKQVLVNLFGGQRRVSVPEFERAAETLFDYLQAHDVLMVVVGFGPVDGLYSPKTNASVEATNSVLRTLCLAHSNALYIGTGHFLRQWDDYLADHVHLNAQGHQRVAAEVLKVLEREKLPWSDLPVGSQAKPNVKVSPPRRQGATSPRGCHKWSR
jgi:lysophospholipase L1-like esterase